MQAICGGPLHSQCAKKKVFSSCTFLFTSGIYLYLKYFMLAGSLLTISGVRSGVDRHKDQRFMLRCVWETQVRHQQHNVRRCLETLCHLLQWIRWELLPCTPHSHSPWLAKHKKHRCSNWLCILVVLKFWTHNTDAGLCITESKQSKTKVWWNLNKTLRIFTVACGFVCVCSRAWNLGRCELWQANCGCFLRGNGSSDVHWINRGPC